jgi:hypothetical protein
MLRSEGGKCGNSTPCGDKHPTANMKQSPGWNPPPALLLSASLQFIPCLCVLVLIRNSMRGWLGTDPIETRRIRNTPGAWGTLT